MEVNMQARPYLEVVCLAQVADRRKVLCLCLRHYHLQQQFYVRTAPLISLTASSSQRQVRADLLQEQRYDAAAAHPIEHLSRLFMMFSMVKLVHLDDQ